MNSLPRFGASQSRCHAIVRTLASSSPFMSSPMVRSLERFTSVSFAQFHSSSSASKSADPSWNPAAIRPYKDKPFFDLINSMAVYQLCQVKPLVDHTPDIIETAEKFGVSKPMNSVIKATFFRHFCGGEDLKEVLPTMEFLKKANIGSVLDLAMEADIEDGSRSGEAAREHANKIAIMMMESIDIASHYPNNFIAVKATALMPPLILQRWTNTLTLLEKVFMETTGSTQSGRLSLEQFQTSFAKTFSRLESSAKDIFNSIDRDNDGYVDWIDITDYFSLHDIQNARLLLRDPIEPVNEHNQLVTDEDLDTAALVIPEFDRLSEHAFKQKVQIMIDAEQTYFQAAIDDIALGLCQKWNPSLAKTVEEQSGRDRPVIYNTYQMYLKDSYARMERDIERARRLHYSFGLKFVRGAYMVSERERAQELNLPDPIHNNIQDSHHSYNSGVSFTIREMANRSKELGSTYPRPLSFVVASHNKDSVRMATQLMEDYGIAKNDGSVGFAQLMGMQDATTYALGANGYLAYKYIPYGPVEVTIPYLHRRAQENSSLLGGVGEDRKNLMREIKIRLGLLRD